MRKADETTHFFFGQFYALEHTKLKHECKILSSVSKVFTTALQNTQTKEQMYFTSSARKTSNRNYLNGACYITEISILKKQIFKGLNREKFAKKGTVEKYKFFQRNVISLILHYFFTIFHYASVSTKRNCPHKKREQSELLFTKLIYPRNEVI